MNLDLQALWQTPNAILAIAVVLGLAVFFHEAGHFLTARLCGIGVEEFALGFGPVLWKRRWGATLYTLRALPFGGFARIAGMEPGTTDDPNGLYNKAKWVQALVFVGGVSMNIALALLFFWAAVFIYGVPDPEAQTVTIQRAFPGGAGERAGFLPGDRVVSVDNYQKSLLIQEVKRGSVAARWGLIPGMTVQYVDGKRVALAGEMVDLLADKPGQRVKLVVLDPRATSPGELFREMNVVVPEAVATRLATLANDPARGETAIGDALGVTWAPLNVTALSDYIAQRPETPLRVKVLRNGTEVVLTVTPAVRWERVAEPGPNGTVRTPHRQVGRIGVVLAPPSRRPTLKEGLEHAVYGTIGSVVLMIKSLQAMLQREISADLGGPIAIMAMTAEQARIGWSAVLSWGGLISANLAIINLLPIPPFDGFHLVMVGWEVVTRRRISERARNAILVLGFVLVLFIFAAFTYKDILNLVRYRTP